MALTNGLIAWYDFENDVLDAANDHDLTYSGTFETGLNGQALTAGSADCYYPHDGSFSQGDSDFTFAFWWKPESLSVETYLTAKGGVGNTTREFVFLYSGNNDDKHSYRFPSGEIDMRPKTPTAGAWNLYIIRYDASADELLVEVHPSGGTRGSSVDTRSGGMSGDGGGADLTIGGRTNTFASGNIENDNNGPIDSYGFWGRRISDTERDTLYNGGAGVAYSDISGGGTVSESLALTATGAPSISEQASADEAVQLVAGATPSVAETASATESVQVQATGSPSIIETLKTKVLETLGLTATATPSVNEIASASESAQVQASGSPSIIGTASVSETLSVAATSTFSITETVGNVVLESLNVTASGSPSVSETASASESVQVTVQGLPSVDESATATEKIEATATAAISVIEKASATEALSVAAKATFRIAETTGAVAVRRVSEIGRNAAKLLTGSGNDAEQI